MSNWEPCRFIDYGDNFYGLMFDDFGPTQQYFEDRNLMGGGYTWHGVVEALVRLQHADLVEKLEYDPEGSMFVARSSDQAALETVAELIRKAQNDSETLQLAVDNADDSVME